MPHQPKYLRTQTADQNDGSEEGEVVCRNCDYRWFPDASRWRNISLSNGGKVLYCPACAVKNRIDKRKLSEIVKHTELVQELRKIGR